MSGLNLDPQLLTKIPGSAHEKHWKSPSHAYSDLKRNNLNRLSISFDIEIDMFIHQCITWTRNVEKSLHFPFQLEFHITHNLLIINIWKSVGFHKKSALEERPHTLLNYNYTSEQQEDPTSLGRSPKNDCL